MFSAFCDDCGTEVLLSTRRIVTLRHGPDGIAVVFRCWRGHLGTWRTGRRPEPASRAMSAVVA